MDDIPWKAQSEKFWGIKRTKLMKMVKLLFGDCLLGRKNIHIFKVFHHISSTFSCKKCSNPAKACCTNFYDGVL